MINKCDSKIIHDIISFDIFYKDFKDNNIKKYNLSYKRHQEYYVEQLYKENKVNNYNDILFNFKENFKYNFVITQKM